MRYHLTPVRMAIIKKTKETTSIDEDVEKREHLLTAGECKWVQLIWKNSMEVPQKIKSSTTIWSSKPTLGYIYKENKIRISERHLHSHVRCSILDNSQDTETT